MGYVEERFFMACDADQQMRAEYGPFKTAEEAEKYARQMGWGWVLVYLHILNGDTVVEVKTRFYQLDSEPWDIDMIREKLAPAVMVPPLSDADMKFFAQYEEQMLKKEN